MLCCQSSQQASGRLKSKDVLAALCLLVGLMRGFLTACTEEVAPLCDLWVAEVLLFPLAFPLRFLGGQNLTPACPGWLLASGRLGLHGGFLLRHWDSCPALHIVAGAQLGEVPPTQAGADASRGEEGWSCVLESHPGAGAASPELLHSPPGVPGPWGQVALLLPLSWLCGLAVLAWYGAVPSTRLLCPLQWWGACAGVPAVELIYARLD